MRIEVLIGNDDPVVYPLNTAKTTLGTSENCDVILNAEGVSRKHITILTEGENYYVIDQGSTNGSYINEERLIPGRKTEFTSFFPVRLGENVLISLISEDEVQSNSKIELPETFKEGSSPKISRPQETSDKTTVISIKELNKTKTSTLINQRNIKRATTSGKKLQAKKPVQKKHFPLMPVLGVLVLVAAGILNYRMQNDETKVEKPEEVAQVGRIIESKKLEEPKSPEYLIPEADLVPKDRLSEMLTEIKCTSDVEILLCDWFPGGRDENLGAVQAGLTVNLLVDGTSIIKEASDYVVMIGNDATPEAKAAYERQFHSVVAYIYLLKVLEKETPLDITKLEDYNISIAIFEKKEDGAFVLHTVIGIKPKFFPVMKDYVKKENLKYVITNGEAGFITVKDKYHVYY